MKLIRTIPTPWHAFAVAFSHDGSRLAIGGGAWYGNGGILLASLDDERTGLLGLSDPFWIPGGWKPAVSSLCFSDDDRYLAASMWSGRRGPAATMLFEVVDLNIYPRLRYDHLAELKKSPFRGPATGVLLHMDRLITRIHVPYSQEAEVIFIDRLPPGLQLQASGCFQHLTDNRVIVVRDTVITSAGGREAALALRDLRTPEAPSRVFTVKDRSEITAIAASPTRHGFITGGLRGEIDSWSWDGEWRPTRLNARMADISDDPLLGGTYYPESIVAIVSAQDAVIAAIASGHLQRVAATGEEDLWPLPANGRPRSLAAHPTRPWVAIGLKQGNWSDPASVVVIVDAADA